MALFVTFFSAFATSELKFAPSH